MQESHNPEGAEDLKRFRVFSNWMDTQFKVPGTRWTFGIDPLLGLVPGAGDLLGFIIATIPILIVIRNGVSGKVAALLVLNIGLDALIGSIPILGGIFDFAYKANIRNLRLLERHYESGKHQGSAWKVIIPVILLILLVFGLLIWGVFWILETFISMIS